MLANLLPGIRDLRAPLAAGYLWLFAAWLTFHDAVPSRTEAGGVVEAVYDLTNFASGIGLAVALSFVAYIVGSLSEAVSHQLVQSHTHASPPDPFEETFVGLTWGRPLSFTADVVLRDKAEETLREVRTIPGIDEKWWYANAQGLGASLGWSSGKDAREAVREVEMDPIAIYEETGSGTFSYRNVWYISLNSMHRALIEEMPLLARRLIGKESDLFATVDRIQSEAEFRFAIFLPFLALSVVCAIFLGPIWVKPIIFLAGIALAAAIYAQGMSRRRAANDTLADIARIERVEFPTIERLRRKSQELKAASGAF
ncbi:MAG TPA: hypothetical protein VHJ82_04085 [Actinomycetota bacterium]|nr:hypothetical protein [Actinomycetota bacterium]